MNRILLQFWYRVIITTVGSPLKMLKCGHWHREAGTDVLSSSSLYIMLYSLIPQSFIPCSFRTVYFAISQSRISLTWELKQPLSLQLYPLLLLIYTSTSTNINCCLCFCIYLLLSVCTDKTPLLPSCSGLLCIRLLKSQLFFRQPLPDFHLHFLPHYFTLNLILAHVVLHLHRSAVSTHTIHHSDLSSIASINSQHRSPIGRFAFSISFSIS